jgi:ABC-type bacteriocin/lantibiotic exporter with double-glycine peptidase domain
MLRCAKDLKLKARAVATDWAGLTKLPLPAIVELKDKSFIIVGKVTVLSYAIIADTFQGKLPHAPTAS